MTEQPTAKESQLAKRPVEDGVGMTPLRWYPAACTSEDEPDPGHQAAGSVASVTERAHHVWVRRDHLPTQTPGLVLEWRQNPDWEALVTWVEPRGAAITQWVPVERLRPAT